VICQQTGRNLYYELHGDRGPWVLLLHHGLGSTQAWSRQIPALVAAGFRVLAYDRWGYGRSSPRPVFPQDYLEREPEDLANLMNSRGIRRAHLVGHSDGGTIALLFAVREPHRVQRMVLIAAHIYGEPIGRKGLEQTLARYHSDREFRSTLSAIHGPKAELLVQNWLRLWVGEAPPELDLRARLSKIRAPTLVVQGQEDEFATPQQAQDIAQGIPDSQLWMVPGGRHEPHQERPAEFNQRMIEFLRSRSRRSTRRAEARPG